MHDIPTPDTVAHLDDQQLASLAASWRTRAAFGDRDAFGAAHTLEVERRRRQRARQVPPLTPPAAVAAKRPWWQRWPVRPDARGADNDPMSPT